MENRKKPGQWIAKCVAKCSHYILFLWVQYCEFHPQAAGLLGTILRGALLKSMGLLFLEVMARRGCYCADTSPLTQPPADQQSGKAFSHYILARRMKVWVFCSGMGLIGNIYSIICHNVGIDEFSKVPASMTWGKTSPCTSGSLIAMSWDMRARPSDKHGYFLWLSAVMDTFWSLRR